MSEGLTAIVEVYRVDPETQAETRVGQAEFSGSGMLSLLEVDPDEDVRLRAALDAVNGKKEIIELVPPTDATEKFQTASLVTKRGDEGFFDAVSRYMMKYYGFSLG